MIYTLTLSPSIDYMVRLDHELAVGRINRISEESYTCGGKGVNVSQVLKSLDVDTTALGFVAGFTGTEIEKGLNDKGVLTDFVHLKEGHSRINIKVRTGEETELNAAGPVIPDSAMVEMFEKIRTIGKDDMLVIAGGVPQHMRDDIYTEFIEQLPYRETKVVVDTTGESFINTLPYHPFLVKPNHEELSQLLGEQISPFDKETLIRGAEKLRDKGAANVLVSLASQGALLLTEDNRVISREAPSGNVRNSVGSGDSMVAGFIAGYLESGSPEDAFFMGLAAGSATAFMEGLAGGREIRELYRFIR